VEPRSIVVVVGVVTTPASDKEALKIERVTSPGFGRFAPGSVEEGFVTTVRRALAVLAIATVGVMLVGATPSTAAPPPATPGYWLVGADGGVFSFGAPFYGSGVTSPGACDFSPQSPSTLNSTLGCDAIASTPSGNGYWILNVFRSATAFGQAAQALQIGCTSLNGATGAWTGLTSSVTGNGFFMTSSNGGVEGCGDAVPSGGLTSRTLNAAVVGIAATPDGKGYWLVSADGGVFSFGDAPFYGSMGGTRLNARVVGIAATPDGKGYWLVAADGGVFSFGDASYYGSMGGTQLNAPVVGIAATPDGKGYWLVAADGGVFSFGTAPFKGSMGGTRLNAPVVGIATFGSSVLG
jgi:hypothetical protein